jgi:hypothetical protein
VKRIVKGTILLLVAAGFSMTGEAHKAVTSKHTYNADVYPIFASRCSHCHADGGVGPMSLMTYADAFPWAESIRTELLGNDEDETVDYIKAAHGSLAARELDVVLDWAVGGTPEGDAAKAPPPFSLKNDWPGMPPDLALRPAAPFAIPAETMEIAHEFTLPTGLARERAVRSIDLLPGAPAVVRDAIVSIRASDGTTKVIGRWNPQQTPAPFAVAPGTILPPGAELVATIHYKKTWKYEGQALTDQSSIGIYFAD